MSIGEKLRYFGNEQFGNITKFANALGVKPPSLYAYLKNESVPGGELLQKLLILGCDINWLLDNNLGIDSYKNNGQSKFNSSNTLQLSEEEIQIINKLKQMPEAIALFNDVLSGIIETRKGLSEIQNLITNKK